MIQCKFAHLADCHLGGWNDVNLSLLNQESFARAVDTCIQEKVDFVIIAGDLFDTSRPSVDVLEFTGRKLKQLQDYGIRVYVVCGSHDYSVTGKTMLNVLDSVGIIKRVDRGKGSERGLSLQVTTDEKTGVKLVGMPGRKGTLESEFFKDLNREELEGESAFNIFVYHSAVEEFRPGFFEKMTAVPLSLFPRGFSYYAGGHVHKQDVFEENAYGVFGFPGATFPNNFRELERFHHGSFLIVTVDNDQLQVHPQEIPIAPVVSLLFDAAQKTPESVTFEMLQRIAETKVTDAIVLVRIEGVLSSGRVTEVDTQIVKKTLREKGAKTVKMNTTKLSTHEYEEINVEQTSSKEELEDLLIDENVKGHVLLDYSFEKRVQLTKDLFKVLSCEQVDGERKKDYNARLIDEAISIFGLTEGEDSDED